MLAMDTEELTDRHIEVLLAIARADSQQAAANQLCLSLHTVKAHLFVIRGRLGAVTTTQAVIVALIRGYFTLEDLKKEDI